MARVELPRVEAVTAKELADLTGLCEKTIYARLKRWERNPGDALGIPYLRRLGKPYRVPLSAVRSLVGVDAEGAA